MSPFDLRRFFMKKLLIILLAFTLAFTAVMFGCTGNETPEAPETEIESINEADNGYEMSFVFEVVDKDGKTTQTTIETNGGYVGAVLQQLGLIEGEEGPYGIYIKKVSGITADYETDGTYWAFYVDGEMSMKGADQVEIVDGSTYSFRVEKG